MMKQGEPFWGNTLLSPFINVDLLTPFEVCSAAEQALRDGSAPLHAVQVFIRQILGWSKYLLGVYHSLMPNYRYVNFFRAKEPSPEFYWSCQTRRNCPHLVISEAKKYAYPHQIHRLVVT